MTTLTITKQDAMTAFKNADAKGKQLLKDMFPKENLSGDITDLVKTIEDAIALDKGWTDEDELYLQSIKKATIVTRVLNEGWLPDYANEREEKWFVWMKYDKAARAFRFFTNYDCTIADSATGSRQVFKSAKLARYFAENFTKLINDVIL